MEDRQRNTGSCGLNFYHALTVAFIVLKLCGVIDWSWLWVLSPLWIPIAIVAVILAVLSGAGAVGWIIIAIQEWLKKRRRKGGGQNG